MFANPNPVTRLAASAQIIPFPLPGSERTGFALPDRDAGAPRPARVGSGGPPIRDTGGPTNAGHQATVLDMVEDGAALADLLLAMEAAPLTQPRIWLVTGFDRVCRVAVAVGAVSALLDACDARLAAIALNSEQAFAGCSGVAARLIHEASRAERLTASQGRLATDAEASTLEDDAPHITGRIATLSLAGMLLAAVSGAWLAERF